MPRTSLLLDACIAINLAATNRLHHVAQELGFTFTIVQQAAAEVGYLRDLADGQTVTTRIDLTRYDGDSPWDRFERGAANASNPNAAGYAVFTARCGVCHTPPLYTDESYHELVAATGDGHGDRSNLLTCLAIGE